MRTDPVIKTKEDPFKDLPPVQKYARKVAIALVFAGVFAWMFKIVF